MMIYPSINELVKKVDSKYTLVIATAKRAREIYQTGITFKECDSDKPVSIAVNEIADNKVSFKIKEPEKKTISDESIIDMIMSKNAYSDTDAE